MISIKPQHLSRYRGLASLLLKHGSTDLATSEFSELTRAEDDDEAGGAGRGNASEIAGDLEDLGPTYVKFGQLLSTRPDLVPPDYVEALTRLQDDVEPVPFDDIREVIESELGARLSTLFDTFEERPLASASLGQVHVATMRDGRKVAVKVQRPGIVKQAELDIEAMDELAGLLERCSETGRRYQVRTVVRELGRTLAEELDYRREARNLTRVGEILEDFDCLVVPRPVEDYCTRRVLVMDYVVGNPVSKLSPVVRTELNGKGLADELFQGYLRQILVEGFFHADPHPGNVVLTDDHRIALLDCGMVGHISSELREKLLGLLLAISEGDGDGAARRAYAIGQPMDRGSEDRVGFRRRISRLVSREQGAQIADIQAGRTVLDVCRAAAENGILMPPELALLGKTLLNLDEIGRVLDPSFDPNEAIQRHAGKIMTRTMWRDASPSRLMRTLLDSKELVESAPRRISSIMELLAENRMRFKVDSFDEDALIVGLQKVSNRIASGIIIGSMFIGAGLLMRVETSFTLLGYPGLAMIFFLAAGLGSLVLLGNVILDGRRR